MAMRQRIFPFPISLLLINPKKFQGEFMTAPPVSSSTPPLPPVYLVDAFTTEVGKGNGAAVVLLPPGVFHVDTERGLAERLTAYCQLIAFELNYSETVFVSRATTADTTSAKSGDDVFAIRWFSPLKEVILCGHATLAASHVLFTQPQGSPWAASSGKIQYTNPLSGPLAVQREEALLSTAGGKPRSLYVLDFPRRKPAPIALETEELKGLVSGLGLSDANQIEEVLLHSGSSKYLVVLKEGTTGGEGLEALRRCKVPTLQQEFRPKHTPLSVTVTVKGSHFSHPLGPFDCVSRHFAPWVGIEEDPVTGAAHVVLGPYWAERLGASDPAKRTKLRCFQASARGGFMEVSLPDEVPDRAFLAGEATTVLSGFLSHAPPTH